LGITSEQKQELTALARRVNFQLLTRWRKICLLDMTPTVTLTNDDDGYEEARAYLWRIIKARSYQKDVS
jgi:hypothetical protein